MPSHALFTAAEYFKKIAPDPLEPGPSLLLALDPCRLKLVAVLPSDEGG
jgi:hypothetical protein